ncbi:hypothetical protein AB0F71_36435 [Kitasatospora sp. NPDC028055]|uniref:hypothetical protein n=1 Tax=Kitasatospora sp. NPDC028055 TaxID=3155653 RepID=UPI0033C6E1A1
MTNTDNVELAVQLADLAAEPAPPPGFDLAASITAGRTRLRRRRRAVAAALATATAGAVTAVLLLAPGGGGGSDSRLVPAAPPRGEHLTAPATPPPTIGSPTDPLVAGGKFGWLPDGLGAEGDTGYSAADGVVVTRAALPGTAGMSLELVVYPDTSEPTLRDDSQQKEEKVPASAVNGRTAYWVTDPTHPTFDSGRRILRWQTPAGHWAQLLSTWPKGTELPDDVLLHVASEVQVGDRPVPLPFWLSGLPAGTRPTSADLTWPTAGQPWVATVGFTSGEMGFGIIVTPADSPPYGKTDQKCRTEQGLRICATVESDSLPLTDRLGGLGSLAAAVHVTGVDRKTWTTQVIR